MVSAVPLNQILGVGPEISNNMGTRRGSALAAPAFALGCLRVVTRAEQGARD